MKIIEGFKIFYLCLLVLFYLFVCIVICPVFLLSPHGYRVINARMVCIFSKLVLRLLGCRITCTGEKKLRPGNYLIVANHVSYLDVLILASRFPSCFVTSQEVRETLFLGAVTTLAGCIFVERRSRQFLQQETCQISQALKKNLSVVIFPEGTSTNGDTVLRFRQPLFRAAIDSKKNVLPVSIVYQKINGVPVDAYNRDAIFWYGDMEFKDHFIGLAGINHIQVTLNICRPLFSPAFEQCDALSVSAHDAVKTAYFKRL
ncbi:MAG: 1-acyl-sn-glycerol-3-phosphate acyltransferase [Pseudomonadota bacterium]